MDKIGICKTRVDRGDFELGKNIKKLRFHDALCNLVYTKPKILGLHCHALILMFLPFVSRGSSEFLIPKNL